MPKTDPQRRALNVEPPTECGGSAKRTQSAALDVYVESGPEAVEVFVRDRGVGFDPDGVGEDRWGVRHSIIDRVVRHGGTAVVRSAPGEGTEVRLRMPVEEDG